MNAAAALIRETGTTDFTMAALADRAVLSVPTPYNLFGSKAGVLFALLNRSLDPVFEDEKRIGGERDPVGRILIAGNVAVDLFVNDPVFYRPLYQYLLGVGDPVQRPAFLERSLQFWRHAITGLVESGELPLAHRGEGFARMMMLNFVAALELWVHDELDDARFRVQVLYGIIMLSLGFATAAQRPGLLRKLRALERELPRAFKLPDGPNLVPRPGAEVPTVSSPKKAVRR
ncbi:MAG: TetR/AcrR family transcriptional regulator [Panacagrimonas sp.]